MSTLYTHQTMWSSPRDRMEHNLNFDMAASSVYIQNQILLNRSEILLRAVKGGLVPLENVLAFPINWAEMASDHMARQRMLQINQNHAVSIANSSLGLYIDHTSTPSSSRENTLMPAKTTNKGYNPPKLSLKREFNDDEEMDAMLSSAVQDTMRDSAGLPIIQDRDETFFQSSLSASPLSDSASSPPTSIPPTPTFSLRELSSEPESFPSSPISSVQSKEEPPALLSKSLISESYFIPIIQPLAKRRKVKETLHLPNLSQPDLNSWWPVSISAQ